MEFADIFQLQAKCRVRLISTEEIWTEAKILCPVYIASSDFGCFCCGKYYGESGPVCLDIRNLIAKVSRAR